MAKYLFVAANEWASWGGSELLWSSTAERLALAGNEVRVSILRFSESTAIVERLRSAGCQIFYRRAFPPIIFRAASKLLPLTDHRRMHMRSAGSGVDLVVVSQGGNHDGLVWMREARNAGLRYVVVAQSASYLSWPDNEIAEKLAKGYEGAVCAYFVSEANLRLTRRQFDTPLRHGRVIRNPFNVDYYAQPPWPSDTSHSLSLACVARLDVGTKAQDVLLDVLSLTHWRERNVRVSLVGDGPNDRQLRSIAKDLRLSNVDFAGHCPDVEEVWGRHHALILPSRFEGMPLVVVEAMLCGRPCIVTDVGGNGELIRDGITGFFAKAATVPLLDDAMNRAWENRGHLQQMGERAAADVRKAVPADPIGEFTRELTALAKRDS